MEQRVAAKAAELAGTDLAVSVRQLYRLRGGLPGRRCDRFGRAAGAGTAGRSDPLAGADERVLTALRDAMTGQATGSTITRKTMFIRVRSALAAEHGDARAGPQRSGVVSVGGAAGPRPAHLRRGDDPAHARQPAGSAVHLGGVLRPGEQVQIDTNTIDILCRYADGVTRRAELTIAVDVATRSILTGVIAPSTKAVDAVAVLARMLVPQPLRPGWPETLLLAHSALPFDRLVSIDARFELAAGPAGDPARHPGV